MAPQNPSNPLFYWGLRRFAPFRPPVAAFCQENHFARRALGPARTHYSPRTHSPSCPPTTRLPPLRATPLIAICVIAGNHCEARGLVLPRRRTSDEYYKATRRSPRRMPFRFPDSQYVHTKCRIGLPEFQHHWRRSPPHHAIVHRRTYNCMCADQSSRKLHRPP